MFSELELSATDGAVLNLLEPSQSPKPLGLKARARPYLVPLGDVRSVAAYELPAYYRNALGLHVELLAPLPLEAGTFDERRRQVVAQELVALMKRRLPHLARDPSAVLIGLTEQDMYIRGVDWRFAFSHRENDRFAVVSTARMTPFFYRLLGREVLLQSRVRKMVSKNVGLLVYRLPPSDDPTSLLYGRILGVDDLDLIQERFEGLGAKAVVSDFDISHRQPPAPPEIRADTLAPVEADGRYPCLLVRRQVASDRRAPAVLTATTTQCLPRALTDAVVDEVEIDLRSGLLVIRRTDLFVPDVVPIALTRCYRLWDGHSRAFGVHASHAWDMFPVGSRQPYTYIDLVLCDGSKVHYDRISKGTGYADAVYEHRQTATPFLESQVRWNGTGWDLRLRDSSLLLFPEAYAARRPVEGAIIEMRDPRGHIVRLERDRRKNLKRITSSGGRFISFEHDESDRIVRAIDDQKHAVRYVYDAGGRLVLVDGSESVSRYSYNGAKLTAIGDQVGRLVEVRYVAERVAELSLAGGRSYHFRFEFDPRDAQRVVRTLVTSPDGSVMTLAVVPKPG